MKVYTTKRHLKDHVLSYHENGGFRCEYPDFQKITLAKKISKGTFRDTTNVGDFVVSIKIVKNITLQKLFLGIMFQVTTKTGDFAANIQIVKHINEKI